jgi:hypothetical protein
MAKKENAPCRDKEGVAARITGVHVNKYQWDVCPLSRRKYKFLDLYARIGLHR